MISACRPTLFEFHVVIFFTHVPLTYLFWLFSLVFCYHSCFNLMLWFLSSVLFFVFLFPDHFCFSAWKSGVWCAIDLTHSWQSVWSVSHTRHSRWVTATSGCILSTAETCEIKCRVLRIEERPSQSVRWFSRIHVGFTLQSSVFK